MQGTCQRGGRLTFYSCRERTTTELYFASAQLETGHQARIAHCLRQRPTEELESSLEWLILVEMAGEFVDRTQRTLQEVGVGSAKLDKIRNS